MLIEIIFWNEKSELRYRLLSKYPDIKKGILKMFDSQCEFISNAQSCDTYTKDEFVILLRAYVSELVALRFPWYTTIGEVDFFIENVVTRVLDSMDEFSIQCDFFYWIIRIIHNEVVNVIWEFLYKTLNSGILEFVERIFRNSNYDVLGSNAELEAEDVTTEVFIALLKRLERQEIPRDTCAFENFIKICRRYTFGIAKNKSMDIFRKLKNRRENYLEDMLYLASGELTLEQQFIYKDQIYRVQSARRGLPDHYCYILKLRFDENLSLKEIAKILDVSEASVKGMLYRAIDELRKNVLSE